MLPPGLQTRFVLRGKVERYSKNECKVSLKEPLKALFKLTEGGFGYRMELLLDGKEVQDRVQEALAQGDCPILLFLSPEGEVPGVERRA